MGDIGDPTVIVKKGERRDKAYEYGYGRMRKIQTGRAKKTNPKRGYRLSHTPSILYTTKLLFILDTFIVS